MTAERLARARRSLDGLSVGDAFGERYFGPNAERRIEERAMPTEPVWRVTDDTVMAVAIVDVLAAHGTVDRDALAARFAAQYERDPARGYGGTAHGILRAISAGVPWRVAAGEVFEGGGSKGNGGAMRVAPLGAYFADDLEAVVAQARASAEVTHAHADGQAGAIAVAVAAAYVARGGTTPEGLFREVLARVPPSGTADGIEVAGRLDLASSVRLAVSALGNGSGVVSHDTVPFALWCAARHLGDYEEALWSTVSGLGDRDTTCAIVGGIVSSHPATRLPAGWLAAREPLDALDA